MIYMENEALGSGAVEFSDEPGVVEWYQSRGWKLVDRPEPEPFVPKPGMEPTDDGWVTLKHSQTGATHDFPNNPDALFGATEVGWEPVTTPSESSDDAKDKTPEDPPAKPKKKAEPESAADTPSETE